MAQPQHDGVLHPDIPKALRRPLDHYLETFERHAPGHLAALYGVGSLGLGDFRSHSNVDLVAVTAPRLDAGQLKAIAGAHHRLRHGGRDARVCYLTWEDLAADPALGQAVTYTGTERELGEGLATPMTWAIVAGGPLVIKGPEHPEVWGDPARAQSWFRRSLTGGEPAHGNLLWRPAVEGFVLDAAQRAEGAITGTVLSKTAAGEAAGDLISTRGRRVLRDAVGFRNGAGTSMYWGPLERRKDAHRAVRELAELAATR